MARFICEQVHGPTWTGFPPDPDPPRRDWRYWAEQQRRNLREAVGPDLWALLTLLELAQEAWRENHGPIHPD